MQGLASCVGGKLQQQGLPLRESGSRVAYRDAIDIYKIPSYIHNLLNGQED